MVKRLAINIFNALQKKSKPIPPVPRKVWWHPLYFIGFGFGSGAAPFAPGTFGTIMAIPFYLLLQSLSLSAYLIFIIAFIAASSWLCDYLSKRIHSHDHPGMCIDEFAGFFVTMIHAPSGPGWIILGFLLFRLFDVWKPWPIRYLDRTVHGGFGMVLDDVVAGCFAFVLLQLVFFLIM